MRDRVKSAAWYIIASSRGSQRATKSAVEISRDLQPFEIAQVRFNLGTMFRDGIGTSADLMTSYLWFSLANTAGDVRAPGAQRNLEQVMTPSQIAEGRRRTAQWLKSHRSRWASTKDMIASNRVK
jgi:localization factor PodJL